MKYYTRIIISLSLLLMAAGCTNPRMGRDWKNRAVGSAYHPDNIYAAERLPQEFKRIVVLPFSTTRLAHDFMPEVEIAIIKALRQQARFEVLQVAPQDFYALTGSDSVSWDQPFPAEFLEKIKSVYAADGILQTEITAFRPYKPLVLGLQSRLFALADARILWSCDEVFDAGNQKVARGARYFANKELEQQYPLQSSYSALLSPQRFASYVGQTLFETLPPRMSPR